MSDCGKRLPGYWSVRLAAVQDSAPGRLVVFVYPVGGLLVVGLYLLELLFRQGGHVVRRVAHFRTLQAPGLPMGLRNPPVRTSAAIRFPVLRNQLGAGSLQVVDVSAELFDQPAPVGRDALALPGLLPGLVRSALDGFEGLVPDRFQRAADLVQLVAMRVARLRAQAIQLAVSGVGVVQLVAVEACDQREDEAEYEQQPGFGALKSEGILRHPADHFDAGVAHQRVGHLPVVGDAKVQRERDGGIDGRGNPCEESPLEVGVDEVAAERTKGEERRQQIRQADAESDAVGAHHAGFVAFGEKHRVGDAFAEEQNSDHASGKNPPVGVGVIRLPMQPVVLSELSEVLQASVGLDTFVVDVLASDLSDVVEPGERILLRGVHVAAPFRAVELLEAPVRLLQLIFQRRSLVPHELFDLFDDSDARADRGATPAAAGPVGRRHARGERDRSRHEVRRRRSVWA